MVLKIYVRRIREDSGEVNNPGGAIWVTIIKYFELITKMYAELQKGFKDVNGKIQATNDEVQTIKGELQTVNDKLQSVKGEVQAVNGELQTVKGEVQTIKNTVIKIEADHGLKLAALFDGHTQVSEKLDRIEAEVSRHDEFILKKIK